MGGVACRYEIVRTGEGEEPPLGATPVQAGEGKLTYENGDTYEGEVVNNLRHGKGKHLCSTGDYYDVSAGRVSLPASPGVSLTSSAMPPFLSPQPTGVLEIRQEARQGVHGLRKQAAV